jgi:protein SCO1/2
MVRRHQWRAALGTASAALASVLLLGWATDGFAVLTTDADRMRRVVRNPQPVPSVDVRSADGQVRPVLAEQDRARTRPRAVIVDFVYTRCVTVCGVLGDTYQQLQRTILERGLEDRVRLLTISFDIAHDTPERLARYAMVKRTDPNVWTLATPVDTSGRDALLQTFGVQVVSDGNGGWVHNAALHVVDPRGRLVRIMSLTDVDGALDAALDAWAATP